MLENAVFIVCEHSPKLEKGEQEIAVAEQVQQTTCCGCGYRNDVILKNQQRQAQAKQGINLVCISPASPRLPELKKKLGI
uniref:Uncharacterized protein n=1 Tax=viral metagenome TaxID=1070528 RepID=A0A6M3J3T8_9ZZZZ